MPEGTTVMDRPRPPIGEPRPETRLPAPLPRDISPEPAELPSVEHDLPTIADFVDQPNPISDIPQQDTEELKRRVLESMGIGSQDFDENHSPLSSLEDMHPDTKKGIMAKISEFFKGSSKLSKIAKISAIPFALLAMIFMKGFKGSKRE